MKINVLTAVLLNVVYFAAATPGRGREREPIRPESGITRIPRKADTSTSREKVDTRRLIQLPYNNERDPIEVMLGEDGRGSLDLGGIKEIYSISMGETTGPKLAVCFLYARGCKVDVAKKIAGNVWEASRKGLDECGFKIYEQSNNWLAYRMVSPDGAFPAGKIRATHIECSSFPDPGRE